MQMATVARKWTVDEVWALPDDGKRYEVIDGELQVTPSPTYRHQRAVLHLAAALVQYCQERNFGDVLPAPVDVVLGPETLVQPDIVVFAERRNNQPGDKARTPNPLLAIEILSPSTARRDRIVKRELYQRERFPEYWIVDPDARVIERWTPDDDRPEILSERVEWRGRPDEPPFTLELPAFFAGLCD